MPGLPKILIIDDLYGTCSGGRNRDRESFCYRAGIDDITGDVEAEKLAAPVAEGYFCSGQMIVDGRVENDPDGTLALIREGFPEPLRWSLVFLDLHFKTGRLTSSGTAGRNRDRDPDNYFGLELLRAIRRDPGLDELPVIILSSMDRTRVEAVFSGLSALDFCDKSLLDRVKTGELLREHGLIEDDAIIGRSLSFLKSLREARKRASHGSDNILVVGESGTGKELLANYIHRWSGRSGAYVPLFTQGVPDALIEDRLFGHEKGAFAGAGAAVPGAAEQADGGTLFIDEFGDIPLTVQAKLLRLLDANIRESQRLGSAKARKLDLQVVMATNRFEALRGETFRMDLLHRVRADHPVLLPPLRERRVDIPLLVEHFLRKYEERFRAEHRTVTAEALRILVEYEWPGNVRALEETIERCVLDYRGLRLLQPGHLGPILSTVTRKEKRPKPAAEILESDKEGENLPPGSEGRDLSSLLAALAAWPCDELPVSALVGSAVEVRRAMARCLAALLRRALIATRRLTPENPAGEIHYTPAIHLLFGVQGKEKRRWPTSKCADQVRGIIALSDDLKDELLEDEVLRTAYEAATRLRKKRQD